MRRTVSAVRTALALAPHSGAAGKELAELYQASSKRCQTLQQEFKELQVGVAGWRHPAAARPVGLGSGTAIAGMSHAGDTRR
jgi:hypothetical protein